MLACLVCVLSGPAVDAATDPAAAPRFAAVRELLQSEVDDGKLAGGVALVWERDRLAFQSVFGGTGDAPTTPDTLFRIASMTKPIASVCALTLVDDGTIALDDPVSKFIPEFADATVLTPGGDPSKAQPLDGPLTVRHLLTHTSGLTYTFWGEEPHAAAVREAGVAEGLAESPLTLEESVRRLAGVPLVSQPGQQWHYSLSTDVLGRVIEVAAETTLGEAMRQRVLDPLDMDSTFFTIPEGRTDRLAALYKIADGKLVRVGDGEQWEGNTVHTATYQLPDGSERTDGNAYQSAGAGLVSTADDYLRFLRMLLGGGELDGVRVLKRDTVKAMTSNQIGEFSCGFPIHGDKFGLGVGVHSPESEQKNGASPGTFGWGGFFHTYAWADPNRQVAGVLMTQLHPNGGSTVWADFQNAAYDALNKSQPAKVSAGPQPGEVYREVRIDNAGNLDWRVTDPRAQARGAGDFLPNPVLTIDVPTLAGATRAEVTLDRWGGHLKTTQKAIRFGRQPWLVVPEVQTTPDDRAVYYYTQDNPTVEVPLDMLSEGPTTVEGLCETRDDYNWGQWGLYSLILRVYYDRPAADVAIESPQPGATLEENPAVVVAAERASQVDVLAWYRGLDEDGDGVLTEWHGANHQLQRGQPAALSGHVGTDAESPFELTWDTEWVPDQDAGAIRLVARVRDADGLWHVSPVVDGLTLERPRSVTLVEPQNVPEHFGVRTGEEQSCTFDVPVDPADVTAARLALRTWHGWDEHHSPLRLNGHLFAIKGHDHHYDADLLPIDPSWLTRGENEFRIHSDTHHHMLEVLWPGPLLLIETTP